ncbi:MAG: hypothetical protein Q9M97_00305 [Candidatus Gracilibacteria bacterium]|nr:hypothetical protein [Candidatus Gracilibacteria bacterium]
MKIIDEKRDKHNGYWYEFLTCICFIRVTKYMPKASIVYDRFQYFHAIFK